MEKCRYNLHVFVNRNLESATLYRLMGYTGGLSLLLNPFVLQHDSMIDSHTSVQANSNLLSNLLAFRISTMGVSLTVLQLY